jgi:esterase/lipase
LNRRRSGSLTGYFEYFLILVFLSLPSGVHSGVIAPAVAPEISGDLDRYLAREEAGVPGILGWAKKGIVWNDPATKRKTRWALVFLHGFTASRGELSPACERIAGRLKANLYFARLRGHGVEDPDAFAQVKAGDWMADTLEALAIAHRLGDRVAIIGSSTGAALAMWAGMTQPGIDALVLYSPNVRPAHPLAPLLAMPGFTGLAGLFGKKYWTDDCKIPGRARVWLQRYRVEGSVQMMELVKYMEGMRVEELKVPTLVVYTPHDKVVDVGAIKGMYRRLTMPERGLVEMKEAGNHVLAGDIFSPSTTEPLVKTTTEFLRKL